MKMQVSFTLLPMSFMTLGSTVNLHCFALFPVIGMGKKQGKTRPCHTHALPLNSEVIRFSGTLDPELISASTQFPGGFLQREFKT